MVASPARAPVVPRRPHGGLSERHDRGLPGRYSRRSGLGRPAFGIDLFIGEPELTGHGHGPVSIRAFLRDVAFPRYGLDLCVIGPTLSNVAAIRAYEKAGFRSLKTYLEPASREQEHYLMALTRAEFDAGHM